MFCVLLSWSAPLFCEKPAGKQQTYLIKQQSCFFFFIPSIVAHFIFPPFKSWTHPTALHQYLSLGRKLASHNSRVPWCKKSPGVSFMASCHAFKMFVLSDVQTSSSIRVPNYPIQVFLLETSAIRIKSTCKCQINVTWYFQTNSMDFFSFRATHYLQYTDAASFTWRKGPNQVFHKKYASSRPHCK